MPANTGGELSPYVIIVSCFAALAAAFLLGFVGSGMGACAGCGCGPRRLPRVKVKRVDLVPLNDDDDDDGEGGGPIRKKVSLATSMSSEYQRNEEDLNRKVTAGQNDAHQRLLARLRRASVSAERAASLSSLASSQTKTHPLTRRASVKTAEDTSNDNDDDDDDDDN